ncbi:MAG: CBS domain-containing protein, partial [Planctomycetia bacterium]|nr:CBS domain-containing protein [Planctomycetia bacterium]
MLLQDVFRSAEDVVTMPPDGSLRHAVLKMREENVGAIVITQGKKVVGILTDRDVAM